MRITNSSQYTRMVTPTSLSLHLSQDEFLAKLEKRLHRIQRGPADEAMVLRKGTATELRRLANAAAEQEHLNRRDELLNFAFADTIADAQQIAHTHAHADTESLLLSSTSSNIDPEKRYLFEGDSSSSDEDNERDANDDRREERLSMEVNDHIRAGCVLN